MNANSKLNELEKRMPGNTRLPAEFAGDDEMTAKEVLYHLTLIGRGQLEGVDVNHRLKALSELAKYHQLTTASRVYSWEDDAVDSIAKGLIDFDILVELLEDENLARRLFAQAGVNVVDDNDPSVDT